MNSSTKTRRPQREIILEHLQEHGSITSGEAQLVYKIPRLAARIGELRERGWNIESLRSTDAAGSRYIRYRIGDPMHPLSEAIMGGALDNVGVISVTNGYVTDVWQAREILAGMGIGVKTVNGRDGTTYIHHA